jgi:hypothetical protein
MAHLAEKYLRSIMQLIMSKYLSIDIISQQRFLVKGAAQRNIKFNVTVRCSFNLDVADFATNITVRST